MAFAFLISTNSSCKKKKFDSSCGCNAAGIKYGLVNIIGTLSYYQYNNKWVLSYHAIQGNTSNYFPCNTTEDSLQIILQNANHSQVFLVEFSGKVKEACAGEEFGYTSGVTTFDYIILDSIKRN